METIYILFISIVIIFCINIIYTTRKLKITDNQLRKLLVDNMLQLYTFSTKKQETKLATLFHPKVLDVYRKLVANPNCAVLDYCTMRVENDLIWTANETHNRRFYSYKDNEKKELELINNSLTTFDKLLLDKLYIAVKENTDTLVTRLFL